VLGAVIAARRPHVEVFRQFRPDFDPAAEPAAWTFSEADLYPDARPTLRRLRAEGYRLAVIANQPAEAVPFMRELGAEFCASSADWQLAKPDPAFFARIVRELHCPAEQIAYVGDRVDNDVLPAKATGMFAVFVRRGPWGCIQSAWPEAEQADLRLAGLDALPAALPGAAS
jgi:FMN phosphatase YigB (HAD superfamily)